MPGTLRIMALLLCQLTCSVAIASDTLWHRIYGGLDCIPTCKNEGGNHLVEARSGGFAAVGYTYSFGAGEQDAWLLRLDQYGDTIWTRTYGGSYSDNGYGLEAMADGGFLISGSTSSYGEGGGDVWLVRVDSTGDTLWTRTYGGIEYDIGYYVAETRDGGCIVVAYTQSFGTRDWDIWLIKTDSQGDSVWSRLYGEGGSQAAYSACELADSGFMVVGTTRPAGIGARSDGWILRTDKLGDTLWAKTYGGPGEDAFYSLVPTSHDGFAVAGTKDGQAWLLVMDTAGEESWQRTYGSSISEARVVLETAQGDLVIAANVPSNWGDVLVQSTSASGDSLWSMILGAADDDGVEHMVRCSDTSFALLGTTKSFGARGDDLWLTKIGAGASISIAVPVRQLAAPPFSGRVPGLWWSLSGRTVVCRAAGAGTCRGTPGHFPYAAASSVYLSGRRQGKAAALGEYDQRTPGPKKRLHFVER